MKPAVKERSIPKVQVKGRKPRPLSLVSKARECSTRREAMKGKNVGGVLDPPVRSRGWDVVFSSARGPGRINQIRLQDSIDDSSTLTATNFNIFPGYQVTSPLR